MVCPLYCPVCSVKCISVFELLVQNKFVFIHWGEGGERESKGERGRGMGEEKERGGGGHMGVGERSTSNQNNMFHSVIV